MEISQRFVTATRMGIVVLVLCCVLTGGVIAVSRLAPAPAGGSIIAHNPCALPCFFGVTPGDASRDDTTRFVARYVAAPPLTNAPITFPLFEGDGVTSLATMSFQNDGSLNSLRLVAVAPVAGVGQLSDVLLAGQKPAHVYRTCEGVSPVRFLMTFGAQDQVMVELFVEGELMPETTITLLDISAAGSRSLYDARASFGCSVETGWHGFAPLRTYFARLDDGFARSIRLWRDINMFLPL